MATGEASLPSIAEIPAVFSNMNQMETLGFVGERLMSTEYYKKCTVNDAALFAEEQKALILGRLVIRVMTQRLQSVGVHMYGYPNMFYRLAHPKQDLSVVMEVLPKMQRLYRAWKKMRDQTARYWMKLKRESQLNEVAVDEAFQCAAKHDFGHAAAAEIRAMATEDSKGLGTTSPVERAFRNVRDKQRRRKDERLAPVQVWLKAVQDRLLSVEHRWAEVDVDSQTQEAMPLGVKAFRPDFMGRTLSFNEIVSRARVPPYTSFKPETMHEQHEQNELLSELEELEDDEGGQSFLNEAPSAWRSEFILPGMVVQWGVEDKKYLSFGGVYSVLLWPLEENKSQEGVTYFSLAKVRYANDLKWRACLSFSETHVKVAKTEFVTSLGWFVRNRCKSAYASPPQGALLMYRAEGPETRPVLEYHARSGFRDLGRDAMDRLCKLELNIDSRGMRLPELIFSATEAILECTPEEAAQVIEDTLAFAGTDFDLSTLNTLKTEAAADCIGRDDLKTVHKYMNEMESALEQSRAYKTIIRSRRHGGGGGDGVRAPVRYVGDRAMPEGDVRKLLPPGTDWEGDNVYAYVQRDNRTKNWRVFYGRPDEYGWRWQKSCAWGPSGEEVAAIRSVLGQIWSHHLSLHPGAQCPFADLVLDDEKGEEAAGAHAKAKVKASATKGKGKGRGRGGSGRARGRPRKNPEDQRRELPVEEDQEGDDLEPGAARSGDCPERKRRRPAAGQSAEVEGVSSLASAAASSAAASTAAASAAAATAHATVGAMEAVSAFAKAAARGARPSQEGKSASESSSSSSESSSAKRRRRKRKAEKKAKKAEKKAKKKKKKEDDKKKEKPKSKAKNKKT